MINADHSDLKALVHSLRTESTTYFRQWVVWLGVGSGAGGIGLFTLAANLPDQAYAFKVFIPSLWLFLVGVVTAGLSVLFESFSMSSRGTHFAEAHNRDEINRAIEKMPGMFSAPRNLADEHNSERNQSIAKSRKSHELAENAWTLHRRWRFARNIAVTISALAFVLGASWPVAFLTFGGKLKSDNWSVGGSL